MGKKELEEKENYSSMVYHNTILLNFEGWIKYIEGFIRCLSAVKSIDASQVLGCIGEIMEYMKELKTNIHNILQHCETILEENEQLKKENEELRNAMATKLMELKEDK